MKKKKLFTIFYYLPVYNLYKFTKKLDFEKVVIRNLYITIINYKIRLEKEPFIKFYVFFELNLLKISYDLNNLKCVFFLLL